MKKFKYKVDDIFYFRSYKVTIVGMNYTNMCYKIKGYPMGHNGYGDSSYDYDENGNKTYPPPGIDYYFVVNENELTPITKFRKTEYFIGQKVGYRGFAKLAEVSIEGFKFDNYGRLKGVMINGINGGHGGGDQEYCYDEYGEPILFTSKNNKYWYVGLHEISYLEYFQHSKSMGDYGKEYHEKFENGISSLCSDDDDSDFEGNMLDALRSKNILSHQSAKVLKSSNKKTKFNIVKK